MWTDEQATFAHSCWDDGMSANQIAEELYRKFGEIARYTRNAVIGKLSRLNVKPRGFVRSPSAARHVKRHRVAPRPRTENHGQGLFARLAQLASGPDLLPECVPSETAEHAFGNPVSLMDLEYGSCRWPIGTPIMFCNGVRLDGYSYCAPHCRTAHRPINGRI